LTPVREALADAVAGAKNPSDMRRRVKFALQKFEADGALAAVAFESSVKADLAGQLMVHAYEARDLAIELDAEAAPTFLNLPFEDAIEAFRRRGIIAPDEFSRLLRDHQERSETVRALMLEQLQERTIRDLDRAIAEGRTFRQWAADMAETGDALGIGEMDHAYLDNVFRTNVMTAYGAGRERAITDPDVMAVRPYWQYRTVDDGVAPLGRVRPNHAALHMLVFRTGNPATDVLRPPGGFSCRCSSVTLARDEVNEADVWETVPPGGEPDEGWDRTPTSIIAGIE
jgi:hypothetical protein